ncbi:hypothetical protein HOK021_01330 [Streptomyces hygroscopicus]|nr:hypothetical protein HOK021_01330 [Streptomyces hygroscopicus]
MRRERVPDSREASPVARDAPGVSPVPRRAVCWCVCLSCTPMALLVLLMLVMRVLLYGGGRGSGGRRCRPEAAGQVPVLVSSRMDSGS